MFAGKLRAAAGRAQVHDHDSDADSEEHAFDHQVAAEDPLTLSQIKRSRVDLLRRYVFLCPTSLSKHFAALPHQAKDSALLVFRCARSWVFKDPLEVRKERLRSRIDCGKARHAKTGRGGVNNLLYQSDFSKEFIQWVVTKEKEGCVFWYKPERDMRKLSQFFEEKIDPVNEQPYRPLLLDPQWWRVRFDRTNSRFATNPSLVVAAISERQFEGEVASDLVSPDIPALQELIYQSNPTLEPIAKWPHAPSMRFLPRQTDAASGMRRKGYIDKGRVPRCLMATTDPGFWPSSPRERRDNLRGAWQTEAEVSSRHRAFAVHGWSSVGRALGPIGSAPASAR
jgi:hypothetical protein